MNYCKYLLTITLIMLSLALNTAAWSDENLDSEIGELLKLSSFEADILETEEQLLFDLAKERITVPKDALNLDEQELFLSQLNSREITRQIKEKITKDFSSEEISALRELYSSKIMLKNKKALADFAKPESATRKRDFFKDLVKRMPDKERLRLIQELADATLMVAQKIYLTSAIYRARIVAPLEFNNKMDEEQTQKIEFAMANYKDNFEQSLSKEILVEYMFIYEDFSNQELIELTRLFKDETRTRFQMSTIDAYAKALSHGTKFGIKAILNYRKADKT